jgi:hypothetical protein
MCSTTNKRNEKYCEMEGKVHIVIIIKFLNVFNFWPPYGRPFQKLRRKPAPSTKLLALFSSIHSCTPYAAISDGVYAPKAHIFSKNVSQVQSVSITFLKKYTFLNASHWGFIGRRKDK